MKETEKRNLTGPQKQKEERTDAQKQGDQKRREGFIQRNIESEDPSKETERDKGRERNRKETADLCGGKFKHEIACSQCKANLLFTIDNYNVCCKRTNVQSIIYILRFWNQIWLML